VINNYSNYCHTELLILLG